jgi:hypothetical protein
MQEVEKKRQEEMDSKMNVTIDLVKGTTALKTNEEDSMFSFGNQNIMANEYMGKQAEIKRERAGLYRPFEEGGAEEEKRKTEEEMIRGFEKLTSFTFKAATVVKKEEVKAPVK